MKLSMPFDLMRWIDANRAALRPPVCNKEVFRASEFIVMVVGGPNSRTDYHDDPGAEIFYQIEGDMLLKTVQDGELVDIPIREGEIFLLPPHVHHSPQRFADSVGIVVERRRQESEQDGFIWYCQNCGHRLYEEYLHVSDIERDLEPVFQRFYADPDNQVCAECDTVLAG